MSWKVESKPFFVILGIVCSSLMSDLAIGDGSFSRKGQIVPSAAASNNRVGDLDDQEIRGKLFDAKGSPVASAVLTSELRTQTLRGMQFQPLSATTGSDGSYIIRGLAIAPLSKDRSFVAAVRTKEGAYFHITQTEEDQVFKLESKEQSVKVLVLDSFSKPLANAHVHVFTYFQSFRTLLDFGFFSSIEDTLATNGSGVAISHPFPAENGVALSVDLPGFISERQDFYLNGPEGNERIVRLVKPSVLHGRVLYKGVPMPGISICASSERLGKLLVTTRVVSDASGAYKFSLMPGRITLSVKPETDLTLTSDPLELGEIGSGQERNNLDFSMKPGCTVEGRVMTDENHPVARAEIHIEPARFGFNDLYSNKDGSFKCTLPKGSYRFVLTKIDNRAINGRDLQRVASRGRGTRHVLLRVSDLELSPNIDHLSGIVVDGSGRTMRNAKVKDAETEVEAITDESGRFTFKAACRPCDWLIVKSDSGTLASVLQVGKDSTLSIVLDRKVCSVSGIVVNDRGLPVPYCSISLTSHSDGVDVPLGYSSTDQQGRFSLSGIPSGLKNYEVTAYTADALGSMIKINPLRSGELLKTQMTVRKSKLRFGS